jgi:hypothetical protein
MICEVPDVLMEDVSGIGCPDGGYVQVSLVTAAEFQLGAEPGTLCSAFPST